MLRKILSKQICIYLQHAKVANMKPGISLVKIDRSQMVSSKLTLEVLFIRKQPPVELVPMELYNV